MNQALRPDPRELCDAAAVDWLEQAHAAAKDDPHKKLPVLFPQLPRRLGRGYLSGRPLVEADGVRVDFNAFRVCDVGALWLLTATGDAPDDALLVDLFRHGDMEECTMALRALGCLPAGPATVELLGEVQRTNTGVHVEAGALDSNVVARATTAGTERTDAPTFDGDDFNRMILKLAFLGFPLVRILDAETHANPELSRMLQDLATEREAAGRPVWVDTGRLIARAPTDGSLARLIGGIENGDDPTRLAAAEGLAILDREELRPFCRERLAREPRAAIREALERAIG